MEITKLSIVLVNYNYGNLLVKCLRSIYSAQGKLDLDVWVVDNASEDDSVELAQKEFPEVHYILNKDNRGFGAANNQVLQQIENEFILTLNPDTEVDKGTLPYMVNYMERNSDVGAVTCKAIKNDGQLDWAYHRGLPTPWASFLYYFLGDDRLYHLTGRDMSKAHEVDAISGSFFLTRKSVLDKVGLFDEDYWMYAEDLDLCYRIRKVGWKVMYVPDVQVVHLKGVSSGLKKHSQEISTATRQSKIRAFNAFYETMKIFYRKHLAHQYPFFINWMVYLAINLKRSLAKRKLSV